MKKIIVLMVVSIALISCKTYPVIIERPEKIDFHQAETKDDLLDMYEEAYARLIEKWLFLIEEIKAADGKKIRIIE